MNSPEQTEPSPPAVEEAVAAGLPDDANDMRGYHFGRLIRTPLTLILIAVLTAAAFVAGLIFIGAAIGAGGALVALLLGVVVVFVIADKRAADDFFEVYAANRGLTLVHGRGRLPQATPLLRKGDDRYTDRTLTGADRRRLRRHPGALHLRGRDARLRRRHPDQLLPLHPRPGRGRRLRPLRPRALLPAQVRPAGAGEVRGRLPRRQTTGHPGERELLEKYEIFATKEQDANWLRQLFSPSFIVWLTDSAPDKFAFELVDGTLCCYVSGHKERAAELDAIAAATGAVAKRLRDEALE